jgi:hypothetical protein
MIENKIITDSDTDKLEDYRLRLLNQLPLLLLNATNEYKDFAAGQTPDDVKSFATHQAACRAALSHLQLLIKIAAWAQTNMGKEISIDEDNELDQLIFDARTAVQARSETDY